MDTRLKDKVAIVTGGARGIGAAFCEGLAEAGAKVVVSDVLDGNPVAARIGETQRPAIYVRADVTSKASVESLVADTVREFGTVDILVNNAGLFADLSMKPFLDIDEDEWDRVMKVNVRGTFQCAKAVASVMIEKKKGRIVNIASGTAFKGTPNLLHYVTSKGAVVSMTRSLARELGPHNICVNAIAPGLTMSEAVVTNPDWTGKASAAGIAARAIQREQVPADLLSTLDLSLFGREQLRDRADHQRRWRRADALVACTHKPVWSKAAGNDRNSRFAELNANLAWGPTRADSVEKVGVSTRLNFFSAVGEVLRCGPRGASSSTSNSTERVLNRSAEAIGFNRRCRWHFGRFATTLS